MIKFTGCTFENNGCDVLISAGLQVKCKDCGHEEKTKARMIGSLSCPVCGSKRVDINGEKR